MSVDTKDMEVEAVLDPLGWFVVHIRGANIKNTLRIRYTDGVGVKASSEDLQAFLFGFPELMAEVFEEIYQVAKEGLEEE